MNSIIRKNICEGVAFNSIKEDKFKTMRMSVNVILPLAKETASEYALLRGVLTRSCKKYPDFTQFSKKLSSLYGTDLLSSVKKSGDNQILTFTAVGLDDRYVLGDEVISTELSQLMCEVLFNPKVENGKFDEDDIAQERRQLLDVIDAEFNDKRAYALSQLVANMCSEETFGIKRYGTVENINSVTSESLYTAWQNMLKNARFEIFYVGDSGADKAEKVFTKAFENIDRAPLSVQTEVVRTANEVKHVTEEMDVSQSKLVIGLRAGVAQGDDERAVTVSRLMCSILGGTANSKLFNNVREKQSLCYYCAARYDKMKGIVIVDSGVQGENIEKTEKAVLKEIEDMKNGIISDFELESTKLAVVNSFKSTNDTTSGIDVWYSSQMFGDSFRSVEEMTEEFMSVTKEEITQAAKKLTLDTVYVLKNK